MPEKSSEPRAAAPGKRARATLRLSILTLFLTGALARPALSQEFNALVGTQRTLELGETAPAWSFEYLQNLNEKFYATFTWLNEGHVTNHHRDGHSVQMWYRWITPSRSLALSGGIGPYSYYDTTSASGKMSDESTDGHGFGAMYSLAARWYIRHPWVAEARYNRVVTSHSISTNTLLLGVGYEFDAAPRAGPAVPAASYGFSSAERSEITLAIGKSVLNNFHSSEGAAWALEYRYRVTPYIEVDVTGIDEGENGEIHRRGLAVSAALSREFLEHRASIGLGLGPYVQQVDEEGGKHHVLGLLTMVGSWRWSNRWSTRAYWDRLMTTNGRDSDVMLIGLGYSY